MGRVASALLAAVLTAAGCGKRPPAAEGMPEAGAPSASAAEGAPLLAPAAQPSAGASASVEPSPPPPAVGPTRIAMSRGGFCGIWADGSARCWGKPTLPGSDMGLHVMPTKRAELLPPVPARSIVLGLTHRCVLLENGLVRELDPALVNSLCASRFVDDLPRIKQLFGGGLGLCAILAEGGEVMCWGGDHENLEPTRVPGIRDAIDVAVGNAHACALRKDGGVWCWGENNAGELGIGSYRGEGAWRVRRQPSRVVRLPRAKQIAAGHSHSCAVTAAGEVRCWGYNVASQLGTGVMFDSSKFSDAEPGDKSLATLSSRAYPGRVVALPEAVGLALSGEGSCALTVDGLVYCWGYLGYPPNLALPTRVPELLDIVQLVSAPSSGMACALSAVGQTWCWGRNDFGVLGEDAKTFARMPQPVRW